VGREVIGQLVDDVQDISNVMVIIVMAFNVFPILGSFWFGLVIIIYF
jgi:hypothetical protein